MILHLFLDIHNKIINFTPRTSLEDRHIYPEEMYEATRDLCHAYIETISDDNTITVEVKPDIISTLYIAPLSARHWTIENPQFK